MSYNYDAFSADQYDLSAFRGPKPGKRAPDFDLSDVNGRPVRLLDFEGEYLVLEMGSITCPLFQGRRPAMARLGRAHAEVGFAVLYVREAHPGAAIGAHVTPEDKRAQALALAEADGEGRRIVVDHIDGRAHEAYGGYPNSVFIINRHGCVVYASDWNDPKATGRVIELLKAGSPAEGIRAFFTPVPPSVTLRVLGRGGKGSLSDFLKSFPRLVWSNLIRRNIHLLLGRATGVDPDARC